MSERSRSSDDKDPLIGRVVDGNVRIVQRVSSGALANVYRAEGEGVPPSVVKVLHPLYLDAPPLRQRFLREGDLARRLRGEGVAELLGAGELDGRPYLRFELIDGELLSSRLARAPLAVEEVARVGIAVLRTLDGIHRRGVVHGDIKPSNLMLLADGGVKLLDFGMAMQAHSLPDDKTPSGPIGTPAYSSPERIAGREVDGRCDLYSLGVMLFEMLSGQRPFQGDPLELVRAHLDRPPPPLRSIAPSVSPALATVVARALEKDPARRYRDALEMAHALRVAIPER